MAFKKGEKRPEKAGRKKGSVNIKTALLKDMILNALDKAGGEDYLLLQATNEPVAFLGLIGKILPKEIDANVSGSMLHKHVTENDLTIIKQYIKERKGEL